MNLWLEYIKYQLKSKRRHGIHSPFVYDLADKCFRRPIEADLIRDLSILDDKLKSDSRVIEITDLGVGSKKLSNKRKVKNIYATSSSRGGYGKMLHRLVSHYKPKRVLELGTSMGIGSVCMARGNSQSQIVTIEGCPETQKIALENFKDVQIENISSIESSFNDYLQSLKDDTYDIVFIDGHHDGKALIQYLELLKAFTTDNTLFILDDIRWSNSMNEAWNALKNSKEYNLSIDLFRMGIISRRPEQRKEHFTLRF